MAALKLPAMQWLLTLCLMLERSRNEVTYKQLKAPCKRRQHYWATTANIVGCYLLHPFAHHVACCRVLLAITAQSLKPVKLLAITTPNNVASVGARIEQVSDVVDF